MTIPFAARLDETIAALASAGGPAGRGIIRISGPAAPAIAAELCRVAELSNRRPTRTETALHVPALTHPLPADLYLWPTGRSFTGQPLAELHTIGAPPLLEAVLAELFARGVRPAQPGEFTLRAFLAGRIDLTQAEAVLGVIDASSEAELQTALDQMAGGLSTRILQLRGELLDLLADLEAGLDFSEEDIQFVSQMSLLGRLGLVRDSVDDFLGRAEHRMRTTHKPRVVLAGPPNAGKSTLFNLLALADRALVSPEAGTTRDYLIASVDLGGLPIDLVDTAGRDSASAGLELQAQELGSSQIDRADLVIWCRGADQNDQPPPAGLEADQFLRVVTKGDLAQGEISSDETLVSAHTKSGISELSRVIAARLGVFDTAELRFVGSTAARCRDSLDRARRALDRAVSIARKEVDQELLAIEIRESLEELGTIAGVVYTDDLLDRIFSKFCIGK